MKTRTALLAALLCGALGACGGDGGPAPGGPVWARLGLAGRQVRSIAVDPRQAGTLLVASAGAVLRSADGGSSFQEVRDGLDGTDATVVLHDPARASVLHAAGWGVLRSVDGGMRWSAAPILPRYFLSLAIDPSGRVLYAGTDFHRDLKTSGVWRSDDGGATWVVANDGVLLEPDHADPVYSLALDPTDPRIAYAGPKHTGVMKTTDGGRKWRSTALQHLTLLALAHHPTVSGTLYAGSEGAGAFKTTDGGATWQDVNAGLGYLVIRALALDPARPEVVYAGGSGGVWRSEDGGGRWTWIGQGLSSLEVYALAAVPGRILAGAADGLYGLETD